VVADVDAAIRHVQNALMSRVAVPLVRFR